MEATDLPKMFCAGCTTCCQNDTIVIQPFEQHKRWKTDYNPVDGRRRLRKKASGHCIYLGARGCTIHGKAPVMCQAFDCREYALRVRKMLPAERELRLRTTQTARTIAEGERRLAALEC